MGHHITKRIELAIVANIEFGATFIAFALLALLAARVWHIPLNLELYDQSFALFGGAITAAQFSLLTVGMLLKDRPERPLQHLWNNKLHTDWAVPDRLFVGVPAALLLPIFFSIFTSLKIGISTIVPFYADPFFADADRLLMGNDAWRILQPIIGLPPITFALNFFYNLWFVVMTVTLFSVTFMVRDLRLRRQYLVAFVLVWALLGNVAAIVFSSAGPCFYNAFYGSPRYADLMNYLYNVNREFPIWALTAQEYLLEARDGPQIGAGISAFPSTHIAIVMLNVMLCRRLSQKWLLSSVVFLLVILIGSVHLGWHYAVDGFASIIAVPIIWWVAGKFSLALLAERWLHALPPAGQASPDIAKKQKSSSLARRCFC